MFWGRHTFTTPCIWITKICVHIYCHKDENVRHFNSLQDVPLTNSHRRTVKHSGIFWSIISFQKQQFPDVLQNMGHWNFRKIYRKILVLEYFYLKAQTPAQTFSCEFCETFKNIFLQKLLYMNASELCEGGMILRIYKQLETKYLYLLLTFLFCN